MKTLLILVFILLTNSAWSVCNTPVSRTNFLPGNPPTSTKYNSDFNNLYSHINNLYGDCIAEASLLTDQLASGAVTTAKVADATVTAVKFASGVVPVYSKPLRVRAYTSSGPWIKGSDVGRIYVQVIGGGGAGGGTCDSGQPAYKGGTSSFGSYCSATGGDAFISPRTGAVGTGSGGDINLSGESSVAYIDQPYGHPSRGGLSIIGKYGKGGAGQRLTRGGSGGGYCAKFIDGSVLADNVFVTVGVGGVYFCAQGNNGSNGIVIIYEYGK